MKSHNSIDELWIAAAKWEQSALVELPILTLNCCPSFTEAQNWVMAMFEAAKRDAGEIVNRYPYAFEKIVHFGGESDRSNHFAIYLRRWQKPGFDPEREVPVGDVLVWQGDIVCKDLEDLD